MSSSVSKVPSAGFVSRTTCRLCQSDRLQDLIHFPDTPIGDEYVPAAREQRTFPLTLALCDACGHLMIREVVEPDLLYGNFTYLTRVSLGLTQHFERLADTLVTKLRLAPGSFVLDVGSNDGTLLRFLKARGMRVLGVDPAKEAVRIANEEGVESLPIYFNASSAEELRRQYGQADLIVSNNTFANIDDLAAFFEAVKIMMKPGAVFVFETGYAVDLARFMIFDNIYHEHLSYFLVRPLERFFRRIGMQLFDAERIDTKGGSVRGYVKLGTQDAIAPSVQALIDLEQECHAADPATFADVNRRIDRARAATQRVLADLKTAGRTIAGYGASVGVTTMIYHLGLAPFIEYIADDNKIKHGLLTPGSHVPVHAPDVLYTRRPDYVVVLAWRYAAPIIEKHPDFLRQGGHFLVPIPELRVI
jgi:SAM-dependent methyltransferase